MYINCHRQYSVDLDLMYYFYSPHDPNKNILRVKWIHLNVTRVKIIFETIVWAGAVADLCLGSQYIGYLVKTRG